MSAPPDIDLTAERTAFAARAQQRRDEGLNEVRMVLGLRQMKIEQEARREMELERIVEESVGRTDTPPPEPNQPDTGPVQEPEVESGHTLPRARSSAKVAYPWAKMRPGDSFLIRLRPGMTKHATAAAARQTGNHWCERNRPDCRILTRTVFGGIRVWMVLR